MNKEAIEQACLDENRTKKFLQRWTTPAMSGPLAEELGTSFVAQQIQDGMYIPPRGTVEYTIAYLKELKHPNHLQNTPTATIPTSTFQEGWKKISEHISSGLTGVHYGHMKACAMDTMLSDFEATICHIPYHF